MSSLVVFDTIVFKELDSDLVPGAEEEKEGLKVRR